MLMHTLMHVIQWHTRNRIDRLVDRTQHLSFPKNMLKALHAPRDAVQDKNQSLVLSHAFWIQTISALVSAQVTCILYSVLRSTYLQTGTPLIHRTHIVKNSF